MNTKHIGRDAWVLRHGDASIAIVRERTDNRLDPCCSIKLEGSFYEEIGVRVNAVELAAWMRQMADVLEKQGPGEAPLIARPGE